MSKSDKEIDSKFRNATEINNELADALSQLGLAECIIDVGRGQDQSPPNSSILGYVTLGRAPQPCQDDAEAFFRIVHTIEEWTVIREAPCHHRLILGHFESPYGAVGRVRRYHPATEPLNGATPTYPKSLLEEVSPRLADILCDRELIELVVDLELDAKLVVLSDDNRYTEVTLHETETSEWQTGFTDGYSSELLGTWANPNDAVDRVEDFLRSGDAQ